MLATIESAAAHLHGMIEALKRPRGHAAKK